MSYFDHQTERVKLFIIKNHVYVYLCKHICVYVCVCVCLRVLTNVIKGMCVNMSM